MAKKKAPKKELGIDSLEVTKRAILKKYGNVMGMMSDYKDQTRESISSGSLGLDIALGNGGFVRGRVYEIFGPPSGGKTTLTMSIIAEAQKKGLTCAFVDAEHSADPVLFNSMGVNTEELLTVKAYIGDENLDVLEMLLKSKNGIGVAVVDSVSALIPHKEAEGKVGDDYVAELARLMSKATRKFVPLVAETNTLLIFINQIRNRIGVYGDPSTTSGGMALDFYATGRIRVEGGESKKSRIDVNGEIIGHKTSFKVIKNKLAVPFKQAEVPLIYGIGYDSVTELFNLAIDLGCIDAKGSWYSRGETRLGQGEDNVVEYLKSNDKMYNEIRDEVVEMTGLKELYEQNSGNSTESVEDDVSK